MDFRLIIPSMIVVAMTALNLFHPGSVAGRERGKVVETVNEGDNSSVMELKGERLSEVFQLEKACDQVKYGTHFG